MNAVNPVICTGTTAHLAPPLDRGSATLGDQAPRMTHGRLLKASHSSGERALALLVLAILVPLEILAGRLAYETLGELDSAFLLMAVGLNLPIALLALWKPLPSAVAGVILGLLLIPEQVILGQRLVKVQREVTAIVGYAYNVRAATGRFPENLDGYTPRDEANLRWVQAYRLLESGDFMVLYRVGTPNTSHWYSSAGGWGYYPD